MFLDDRPKVEKLIEDPLHTEAPRKYLGLSGIGHPCKRAIWYAFRMYLPPKQITQREKRLYGRGHREEPIIIADLKKIGVELINTQDECSTCSGHVKGHLDAVLKKVPGLKKYKKVLGEFKTSKTKYFLDLVRRQSVKKAFQSHYDQMQAYMHLFKIKAALYICVNKEDDSRYYEIVKYDKGYCKILMEKAEDIVLSEKPPYRLGNSSYYRCGPKWCEYRKLCHFDDLKHLNKTCRSCKHVEIHEKGVWYCGKRKEERSWQAQQKGCKKWSFIKTD